MKAVEMEAKRNTLESFHWLDRLTLRESKREAKREWREAHEKELKERRLRGITEKNAYGIDWNAKRRHLLETSEVAQKRDESKKQKERNRVLNYGWNIFGEVLVIKCVLIAGRNLSWLREASEDTANHSRVSREGRGGLRRPSGLRQQFAALQRDDRPLGGGTEEAGREAQPVQQAPHLVGNDGCGDA